MTPELASILALALGAWCVDRGSPWVGAWCCLWSVVLSGRLRSVLGWLAGIAVALAIFGARAARSEGARRKEHE